MGCAYGFEATVTRKDDTTAYTAGDVIGPETGTSAIRFGPLGTRGSDLLITSVSLMVESTGLISGEGAYTLHLYDGTPASALADNAAFDLPSGDRNAYIGSISLGTPVDIGSTLYVQQDGVNKQISLESEANALWGYLVTVGGYTPTAERVYRVGIHTVEL